MSGELVITVNRKARFDYEIVERFEAGISLLGSEVKALRDGRANLKDAYAAIDGNRVFLLKCHIGPYKPAGPNNQHEAERPRPLLFHKREIDKLRGRIVERGFTLVPLRIYFRGGIAKVEMGEKERETIVRVNGQEAVELEIYKEGSANTKYLKTLNRI